jgi:hypothetical protein
MCEYITKPMMHSIYRLLGRWLSIFFTACWRPEIGKNTVAVTVAFTSATAQG